MRVCMYVCIHIYIYIYVCIFILCICTLCICITCMYIYIHEYVHTRLAGDPPSDTVTSARLPLRLVETEMKLSPTPHEASNLRFQVGALDLAPYLLLSCLCGLNSMGPSWYMALFFLVYAGSTVWALLGIWPSSFLFMRVQQYGPFLVYGPLLSCLCGFNSMGPSWYMALFFLVYAGSTVWALGIWPSSFLFMRVQQYGPFLVYGPLLSCLCGFNSMGPWYMALFFLVYAGSTVWALLGIWPSSFLFMRVQQYGPLVYGPLLSCLCGFNSMGPSWYMALFFLVYAGSTVWALLGIWPSSFLFMRVQQYGPFLVYGPLLSCLCGFNSMGPSWYMIYGIELVYKDSRSGAHTKGTWLRS